MNEQRHERRVIRGLTRNEAIERARRLLGDYFAQAEQVQAVIEQNDDGWSVTVSGTFTVE